MAAKPVIKNITPFDARLGTTLYVQYSGNIPYYNKVVIQDASSQTTVYSRYVKSSATDHRVDPSYKGAVVIAGDTAYQLINGRRYTATIQFFDKDQNPGLVSDKATFVTRSTPAFYFKDLNDGTVIGSSSVTLDLTYGQSEGEGLGSYRYAIYDDMKVLLQESEIFYDATHLSYTFKGLENQQYYYVQATGVTKNGIELDTGLVEIQVYFENPGAFSIMNAECNTTTTAIDYYTNYIYIEADEGNDFTYSDSYIYIEDAWVTYSKGFEIEGDATWHIRCKDADYQRVILKNWNKRGEFYVETLRDTDLQLIVRLVVPSGISNYILYSQSVYIDWYDILDIWVRRQNNIYSLDVFVTKKKYVGDVYLQMNEPTANYLAEADVWLTTNDNVMIHEADFKQYVQDEEPDANQWEFWASQV